MSSFLSDKTYVLKTRGVDGTLVIGMSFIFLAYFLHPAIESSYERVRAYRAWRSIEKRQSVDVTKYPIVAEVFGGRGKWDAARIITVMLAVFSMASWGLELSMGLAYYEGYADLLNRPPPVTLRSTTDADWQVKTQDELGYTAWYDLENIFEGDAKSRYYMEENTDYEGFINGIISIAFWYTEPEMTPTLFYYLDNHTATVNDLNCTDNAEPDFVDVYLGDDTNWGTVYECEKGPSLTSNLQNLYGDKTVTPPTIVMTRAEDEEVVLIVEESSSYPNFMYSIWTVGSVNNDSTELKHEFHISATMRIAEAVVTGIVNGKISGGDCFGLLRKFSENREQYGSVALRASPFGEHPAGDSVQIRQLEYIEVGLEIGVDALLCFVWLMVLTSIGITWSFCLRSSIGMDVYDRDELIRAVAISGATAGDASPTDMRIFVQKADTGVMRVEINDTGDAKSGCARILRRAGTVVEDSDPTPTISNAAPSNGGFGGAVVPIGSRTVVLEGVRIRHSRPLPGPNGNYRYPTSVSLTASPVPSSTSSVSATPTPCPSRPNCAGQMGHEYKGGRGASVLFDTVYSPSDSDDDDTHVTKVICTKAIDDDDSSGALTSAFSGETAASGMSKGGRPPHIEMPRRLGQRTGDSSSKGSPGRTSTNVSEGSPPLPHLLLVRDFTLGPPQLGPLSLSCDEEPKESTTSPDDMC